MKLKILGSVSPYPKGNKNCVSYFITTNGNKKILLDVGPGSTRLLNMRKDLNNLIVIISHLHRDHYSDISALAYASFVEHNLGYLSNRIKVYIPKTDKNADYELLVNYGDENYLEFISYDKLNLKIDDNTTIISGINPHNIVSNSIKIKEEDVIFVYSGDTGFKNNTITSFSKNADLLICESTFLKGQKKLDYHLCAYEAGIIASNANVKSLLLTHFYPEINSQKYVDEASKTFVTGNIYAASENDCYVITPNKIIKKKS